MAVTELDGWESCQLLANRACAAWIRGAWSNWWDVFGCKGGLGGREETDDKLKICQFEEAKNEPYWSK